MSEPKNESVHISPAGESWDVETETQTLGSAGSKEEALEIARAVAEEAAASSIVVHTSEGTVEKQIELPPPGA